MSETEMILAAAPFRSVPGSIEINIERHLNFAAAAKSRNVDLLMFPELSLTGYEPDLAKELQTSPSDERFHAMSSFAQKNQITICAGLPLRSSENPEIGMVVWRQDGARIHTRREFCTRMSCRFSPADSAT